MELTPLDEVLSADKEHALAFLGKLCGPALEEVGQLLADQVRYWRLCRLVRILLRSEELLKKNRVNPDRVSLKVLFPLLENASLEEDENLQEKWASLLASAASAESQIDLHVSYVEILKELSPLEARVLDTLFDVYEQVPTSQRGTLIFDGKKVCEVLQISRPDMQLIVSNLFRLGLLRAPTSQSGVTIENYPVALHTYDLFQLTPLAVDFLKHCRYGRQSANSNNFAGSLTWVPPLAI